MKKLVALLLAVLMLVTLCACGKKDEPSVYYLNFKPEADAAWQELAKLYTEKTGVEVKVVTAASGTYSDTLTAEMAKSEAPTLFQCGNAQSLKDWGDYCYDFTGSDVLAQMTTSDFNMVDANGAVKAIGYCYEAFGIIVNVELLEAAGHNLDEITDFASLKAVADDIHARAAELGFDAFSAPGLEGSSSWRFSGHLANMPLYYEFRDDGVTAAPATITGAYMDAFRNIWDLYITDTAADPATLTTSTGDESTGQFKAGEAVFYQNGTWEYAGLIEAGLTDDQLAMIPIYCGAEGEENTALCSGTQYHWAVNAKVSSTARQASLDFLEWLVTDPEATTIYSRQAGAVPFQNAPPSPNKFILDGIELLAAGKAPVSWAFQYAPNTEFWSATVATGLAAYAADPTDDTWQQVVGAFVDGWAYEYTMVNN